MYHRRYGDLSAISRKTAARCHLCHGDVDLGTYGHVHAFGSEPATVDHLDPQSFGGGDEDDNLLLTHHGCNSSRGNGDIEETRLALAGTPRAPLSSREKALGSVVLTLGGGALAGHAFARMDEQGNRVFNEEAALWGGFVGLLVSAAL